MCRRVPVLGGPGEPMLRPASPSRSMPPTRVTHENSQTRASDCTIIPVIPARPESDRSEPMLRPASPSRSMPPTAIPAGTINVGANLVFTPSSGRSQGSPLHPPTCHPCCVRSCPQGCDLTPRIFPLPANFNLTMTI